MYNLLVVQGKTKTMDTDDITEDESPTDVNTTADALPSKKSTTDNKVNNRPSDWFFSGWFALVLFGPLAP